MSIIRLGPEYFPNPDVGRPIANADIYVGEPDTDPTVVGNQKTVTALQESGVSVTIAQPINTGAGGVPLYNGSPVTLSVDGNYSLKVLNSLGSQVYYVPNYSDAEASYISFQLYADLRAFTGQSDGYQGRVSGRTAVGDGGDGAFYFDDSDLSTEVAADTQSGMYVAPNSDLTGASGAWVRSNAHDAIPEHFGATTAASDNFTELQAAIDSGLGVLRIDGTYKVDGLLEISAPIVIEGKGELQFNVNSNNQGIKISSSDVKIEGISITGPQFAALDATQNAVFADSTLGNELERITVERCTISNWGGTGVRLRLVNQFNINNNDIYDVFYNGVEVLSVDSGDISQNRIDNIIGPIATTGGTYGISVTKNNGDEAVWPRSKNVTIDRNKVSTVVEWEGIDTHGGENISITNNVIIDCVLGVVITRFNDGTFTYPPENCSAINNTIVNETLATTAVRSGLQIVGDTASTSVYSSGCKAIGNTIDGYGASNAATADGGAIYARSYNDIVIESNTILNSGYYGIYTEYMGGGIQFNNNIIKTITNTSGYGMYFYGRGDVGDGVVSGNVFNIPSTGMFYANDDVSSLDFYDNKRTASGIIYSQNGGTYAAQYLGEVSPVYTSTATWDPGSIAAGSSSSFTITGIPGCSAVSSVTVSVNRDLQGMTMQVVSGNTDTNSGTATIYLYNNTAGAIDLASLSIKYKVENLT